MKSHVASRSRISWSGLWLRVLWLALALAATSLEWAESADTEDLTQYGRKWEEVKTNWGSELDRHNMRMDELNKMPPGPERDGLISKEMQGHRTASQNMARQRQEIHDKVIQEVNRRTGGGQTGPDGKAVPEARQTEGTKVTDPKHRGIPGDTDVGGTARQADNVKQVLKDMGIKAGVKTTPSTIEVGDDFNFTVNKEGKLGKPGSGAHQTQVHVDARNKETYVSEGMSKNQPGRDYVQVQDHKKKAMGGLKSSPEDLARNPDSARDMVKGTSKTMDHLSDAEISKIMKKNNIPGTPQDFRDHMKAIKEGRAAVTPENAAKLQQASRDVFDKAESKTKAKADREVAKAREEIGRLEKTGAKQEAQKLREQLADSKAKVSETGAANKEATRKGPSETAGKSTNEVSSRKPAGPAEPSGKAPMGEPSGQTAGKVSPEPAAKGTKPSVEPSSAGKTTTAESSAPKGERGPVEKSATNKPSTPEEWRRWNEQRVPESVRKKGPGIPESNMGRDFVKGLPKHPTDPTPPVEKPFGSGMTPEQKATYDKMIKEGVPHRASPGHATTAKPSGPQGGQPIVEPATEPTIKEGKPSAKTVVEPTGKPAGQVADAPKGKGPTVDTSGAPKGKGAAAPEGTPSGKAGKALEKAGKAMIAVDILSGAEDFKEAAKKGDVEGMKDAAVATADSFTGGAKGTYDTVTTKLGDAREVADKEDYAQKKIGEAVRQQLEAKARRMGAGKEAAKEALDAYEKGDKSKFHDLVNELQAKGAKDTKPSRPLDSGKAPDADGDDTAWDRTKEVGHGMAERVKKAGKFLDDTRKDLTEIGTGLAEKGTRDAVIEQVKENVSTDNIQAGFEARQLSNKADVDRAAARRTLADKLVEKGASRDEAEQAVSEWDRGDHHALNELKERIRKERVQQPADDAYDPRRDPNVTSSGIGRSPVDFAQVNELSKEFHGNQAGGKKTSTAQGPQQVIPQPESYRADPGKKANDPGGAQQVPYPPYPADYPSGTGQPGVRVPWKGLIGQSQGYGGKSSGGHGRTATSASPVSPPSSSSSGTPSTTPASTGAGKQEPTPADLKAAYNEGCTVGKQVRNGELSSAAVKELMRTKYDLGNPSLKGEFRRGWGDCSR